MNTEIIVFIGTYLLVAALTIAHPWFSRKNVLFGVVFGSADVWNTKEAKAIRRRYLVQAIVLALTIAAALICYYSIWNPSEKTMAGVFTGFLILLLAAEILPFLMANRCSKTFKAASKPDGNLVRDKITVETKIEEKKTVLSAGWLFLLLPLLLADVLIAFFGYDQMPSRIVVHYGLTGPDGWVEKSAETVIGLTLLHILLTAVIVFCAVFIRRAPASVRGNPQAAPESVRFRKLMLLTLLFTGVFMQAVFLMLRIANFVEIPVVLLNLILVLTFVLIIVMFYIYFRFVRTKKAKGEILDDDARWIAGMFYYNPSDPAVFVEKRTGIGYTVNFARPAAWLFLLGVLAIVLCSLILL